MAAPSKTGLDYYPRRTDFFSDRDFIKLRINYGNKAVGIYEQLLDIIFGGSGYYVSIKGEERENLLLELWNNYGRYDNMKIEEIEEIFNDICTSLFDSALYARGILTSKNIQAIYYTATLKRKSITVDRSIWLIDVDEMNKLSKSSAILKQIKNELKDSSAPNDNLNENSDELKLPNDDLIDASDELKLPDDTLSRVNDVINPQSKVNQSKVNQSKPNQSKPDQSKPDQTTNDGSQGEPCGSVGFNTVLSAYEKTYGRINDNDERMLAQFSQTLDYRIIADTLRYCRENGKAFNYCIGILKRLGEDGTTTWELYKQREKAMLGIKQSANKFINYNQPVYTDAEIDAAIKRKKKAAQGRNVQPKEGFLPA